MHHCFSDFGRVVSEACEGCESSSKFFVCDCVFKTLSDQVHVSVLAGTSNAGAFFGHKPLAFEPVHKCCNAQQHLLLAAHRLRLCAAVQNSSNPFCHGGGECVASGISLFKVGRIQSAANPMYLSLSAPLNHRMPSPFLSNEKFTAQIDSAVAFVVLVWSRKSIASPSIRLFCDPVRARRRRQRG